MSESLSNRKSTRTLPYSFIYFDLDDTLLDHKSAQNSALKDLHTQFELFENLSLQQLTEVYGSVNSRQWKLYSGGEVTREELQRNRFELTLRELELDCSYYEEIGTCYLDCYRNYWQWIEGAREAYLAIAQRFSVGILTNGFSETQTLKFEAFDLHATADHLVISEDVGALKPDPKVFEYATRKAGVAPENILYVGDSFSSDIMGGSSYGWNTAWFTRNGDPDMHAKADYVFSDFTELSRILNL